MLSQLRPAIVLVLTLTVLTGVAYPLLITGIAQGVLPHQANGSLLREGYIIVGSTLIGQTFTRPENFHSRHSAAGAGYDAGASSGSNLGPTSALLAARIDSLSRYHAAQNTSALVPVDMVTASASGLDPHISPASAYFQVPRVSLTRGVPVDRIRALVDAHVEERQLGFLGERRVNVLLLNRSLNRLRP